MTPAASAFLARYESKFTRDPLYGCWLWTTPIGRDGYGTIYRTGGPRDAHREMYRELVGEPPPGRVLDHWCRRRRCVRPAHLEPVTGAENDRRRSWAYRCRLKVCPRGHSLWDAIVTPSEDRGGSGRLCRRCMGPEVAASFAGIDRGISTERLADAAREPVNYAAAIEAVAEIVRRQMPRATEGDES